MPIYITTNTNARVRANALVFKPLVRPLGLSIKVAIASLILITVLSALKRGAEGPKERR